MNCQVSHVTGFSPFKMVYKKQAPAKLDFDFDPTKSGVKVDTLFYILFMKQGKALLNQLIMARKKYEESQLTKPSNIFNCDETGIFFRAVNNKSFILPGEAPEGVKTLKERVSVLLTCSSTGKKIPPLIIGKSAKP